MLAPIELKQFFLNHISYDWKREEKQDEQDYTLEFSFDLKLHSENPNLFKLELEVDAQSANVKENRMNVQIVGFFEIDQDIKNKEEREWLMIVNGAMILYGILRGEVAMITSNAQGGKFILPTVNMNQEFNKFMEKRKVASPKDD